MFYYSLKVLEIWYVGLNETRCWNKKWPCFCEHCRKSSQRSFELKSAFFKIAQKVAKYLIGILLHENV